MKRKKKDSVGSRDLISDLPDAVICHILSFLPTKEAASTSVLAKRWKCLLAFVHNLDFDDSYFYPPISYEERRTTSFIRFVDSVLALQAKVNAPLKRFHVTCKDIFDQFSLLDWIFTVLKRGVEDIDLYMPSSDCDYTYSHYYPLPPKIFVSKTLVKLKIKFEDGVNIDVEGDVFLPKLKTLYLDYFKVKTNIFNKLLSGCTALEELVLVNLVWCWEHEPSPVTVAIPTLKRLKFCHSEYFDENEEDSVSLSFDNPNLVYLEYSGTIADRYQQVSFGSLVEASLGLRMTYGQIVKVTSSIEGTLEPQDETSLKNLLMGVCNVKILYLSDDTLKVLNHCRETIPVFKNLMQLTIKPWVEWESLPALLKNCPNLETLVFEGLHHDYTERCRDEDGCLCLCPDDSGGSVVRNCLLSSPVKILKILTFGENFDDEGIEEQLEQVKHFLNTMPVLEQMIVYYNTSNDEDVMKVFKKLQELPRVASAKCSVQIISVNLSLSLT